ncbi:Glycogen debranching enzyme like protein, partial [Aduncisulcus paluster]
MKNLVIRLTESGAFHENDGFIHAIRGQRVIIILPRKACYNGIPDLCVKTTKTSALYDSHTHKFLEIKPNISSLPISVYSLDCFRDYFASFILPLSSDSVEIYLSYSGSSPRTSIPQYLSVNPQPKINGKPLPLDCIMMQTVHSRILGPLEKWKEVLKVSSSSGYNMIHFSPVNQIGGSNSAYSIYKHHSLNHSMFPKHSKLSNEEKWEALRKVIADVEREQNMLSICDVVWNHASYDCETLWKHPQCAYNTHTHSYLLPAFVFDCHLKIFSNAIAKGKYPDLSPVTSKVNETEWLGNLRNRLHMLTESLNLHEYIHINISQLHKDVVDPENMSAMGKIFRKYQSNSLSSLSSSESDHVCFSSSSEEFHTPIPLRKSDALSQGHLVYILGNNYHIRGRNKVILDVIKTFRRVIECIRLAEMNDGGGKQSIDVGTTISSQSEIVRLIITAVEKWNVIVRDKMHEDMKCAVNALCGDTKYRFFNPQSRYFHSTISSNLPLYTRLFVAIPKHRSLSPDCHKPETTGHGMTSLPSWYPNTPPELSEGVYQPGTLVDFDSKFTGLAVNGWVMCDKPTDNFATNAGVYIRREIVAWGDCVKLYYGNVPEDSPLIWKLMEDYTKRMASVFHGFRVDNAHGTPAHVARHMLTIGRQIRRNLYVNAELFTGDAREDVHLMSKLAIQSLIREGSNPGSTSDLSSFLHRLTAPPVGTLYDPQHLRRNRTSGKTLSVPSVLFDCTHDNIPFVAQDNNGNPSSSHEPLNVLPLSTCV